jgi:hypothetical protein
VEGRQEAVLAGRLAEATLSKRPAPIHASGWGRPNRV